MKRKFIRAHRLVAADEGIAPVEEILKKKLELVTVL